MHDLRPAPSRFFYYRPETPTPPQEQRLLTASVLAMLAAFVLAIALLATDTLA
jgi:hypothetical protein